MASMKRKRASRIYHVIYAGPSASKRHDFRGTGTRLTHPSRDLQVEKPQHGANSCLEEEAAG